LDKALFRLLYKADDWSSISFICC